MLFYDIISYLKVPPIWKYLVHKTTSSTELIKNLSFARTFQTFWMRKHKNFLVAFNFYQLPPNIHPKPETKNRKLFTTGIVRKSFSYKRRVSWNELTFCYSFVQVIVKSESRKRSRIAKFYSSCSRSWMHKVRYS